MDFFKFYYGPDKQGCDCGDSHDTGAEAMDDAYADEAEIVLVDPDTGEEFAFILYDNFVLDSEEYCVLVAPDEEDEEGFSWIIMQYTVDDDGEEILMSLAEEDEDRVYAAYEAILDELAEDEEYGED